MPRWAREGAWLCWSLDPVAMPVSAGRCPGSEGSCPVPKQRGQAGCLPTLWAACSAATSCHKQGNLFDQSWQPQGGESQLGGEVLCIWRGPQDLLLAAAFVSYHTDNMGTGATQRLHSRKLLFPFVPDVFQRKTLGRVKGKCGEGGGTGVLHIPPPPYQRTGNLSRSHACNLG